MNINPIKIQNNKQNQNRTKTSFKSIIPVKIYDNDMLSTSVKFNEKVFRLLITKLFAIAGNPEDLALKAQFEKVVKDYENPKGSGDKSKLFRYRAFGGVSYLFNGRQAEHLDALGREIGPAKHRGLQEFGTTKTTEVRALGNNYSERIHDFITLHNHDKLRGSVDTITKKYTGPLMGLCVFIESVGQFGKRNHKISLKGIKFKPITDKTKGVHARYLESESRVRNCAA